MDVKEAFEKINNLDVQDLKKIGTAPKAAQIAVIVLLCVAIIAGMGWFLVKPAMADLNRAQRKENQLRDQFKVMQSKAANLDAYRKQLAEMKDSFGAMLRQLPDETDMESLLIDLSQTSVAAGLEVKYFKPGTEDKKEFYAEYPIELRVTGTYHEFGKFVSGLASLPRIVTLHDIQITPASGNKSTKGKSDSGADELNMTLTAKTYRYLKKGESGDSGGKGKNKKRKKR